jgi:uncharacterized membrane protein
MYGELIALRIIHIIGGIFWLGTSLFIGTFLFPVLQTLGPAGGAVIAGLHKRKAFTVVPTVAILNMLAGTRLMWIQSNGFSAAWYATRAGKAYAWGGTSAIIAFVLFMSVAHPALLKNIRIGAQMATASDADKPGLMKQIDAGRKRGEMGGRLSGLFLLTAAILMAIGRYL